MYNQDYEEYMRNVLGYTPSYENTYREANNNFYGTQSQPCFNDKLEAMYPEIYRTIYPLVIREVGMNTRAVTEDVIEEIVTRICNEVENEQNNRAIEMNKTDVKSNSLNTTSNPKSMKNSDIKEDRVTRPRNNLLRDLIRILLLREIIGRPGFPNRPPRPGRPPFPGGPGMPPPMPRDYYM